MSWIKHVKTQLEQLDVSTPAIRKFALLIGGILIAWAGYIYWKGLSLVLVVRLLIMAGLLLFSGLWKPAILVPLYRGWMALAFAMGWVVSHVILILFYFLVITPIGLILRLVGKELMDVSFKKKRPSYWVRRSPDRPVDYEKMY